MDRKEMMERAEALCLKVCQRGLWTFGTADAFLSAVDPPTLRFWENALRSIESDEERFRSAPTRGF